MFMEYMVNRAKGSPVPVAINLDHCKTYEGCVRAIKWGVTSVMIDGSELPMEENIELTQKSCGDGSCMQCISGSRKSDMWADAATMQ